MCSDASPVCFPGPGDEQHKDFVGQDGVFVFAPYTH